jgi:hypothetical protein
MAVEPTGRVRIFWPPGLGTVTRQLGRAAAVSIAAGLTGGFVAGLLARTAMRVIALATPGQSGLLTENGAVVGAITSDGTAFVIVAGAFLGLPAGLVYLGIRRWLPAGRWPRSVAFGALSLCLGGGLIITAANPDFARLGTPGLDIAVFVLSFLVAGMAISVVAEWLDVRLPPTGPTDTSRLYLGVYAALVVASIAFLFLAVIVALLPYWYLKATEVAKRDQLSLSIERGTSAWRFGRYALVFVAGVGFLRLAIEAGMILAPR